MSSSAFSSTVMATHFESFGSWLLEEVGEHKAAISINRYLSFFMEIERLWRCIPEYLVLLNHFGAASLRRVLLPMRWMELKNFIVIDEAAKSEDSDRRRLSIVMEIFPSGSEVQTILEGYYNVLVTHLKAGKTSQRSIWLALSPAAALLAKALEMTRIPPDQWVLDAYLAKSPGQRAALSGFVRYLRQAHGAEISLPKAGLSKTPKQRRKKLEVDLIYLIKENGKGNGNGDDFMKKWLSVALEYFHGIPKRAVGRDWKIFLRHSESDGGLIFRWNGFEYWLPSVPSVRYE